MSHEIDGVRKEEDRLTATQPPHTEKERTAAECPAVNLRSSSHFFFLGQAYLCLCYCVAWPREKERETEDRSSSYFLFIHKFVWPGPYFFFFSVLPGHYNLWDDRKYTSFSFIFLFILLGQEVSSLIFILFMRFLAQTIKRKIEKEVIAVRAHSVKMTGVSSYLFIFSFEIRSSSKRIVRSVQRFTFLFFFLTAQLFVLCSFLFVVIGPWEEKKKKSVQWTGASNDFVIKDRLLCALFSGHLSSLRAARGPLCARTHIWTPYAWPINAAFGVTSSGMAS